MSGVTLLSQIVANRIGFRCLCVSGPDNCCVTYSMSRVVSGARLVSYLNLLSCCASLSVNYADDVKAYTISWLSFVFRRQNAAIVSILLVIPAFLLTAFTANLNVSLTFPTARPLSAPTSTLNRTNQAAILFGVPATVYSAQHRKWLRIVNFEFPYFCVLTVLTRASENTPGPTLMPF